MIAEDASASVFRLPHAWFIACRSEELGAKPLARTLQARRMVLFRGRDGRPSALTDRCPHRNVPLSAGAVRDGVLECRYHGWRFDPAGECIAVPGLVGEAGGVKGRRCPSHAVVEQDGFVWVYATPDVEPRGAPFRFPHLGEPGYTTLRRELRAEATMHAAIENALDVPHTAFLHGGLFRTARKEHEIEVVVRRHPDRVEAEYLGEPRPPGLIGRLLAPGGGEVIHFDRFILPSIAQVEYRLGERSHVVVTSAFVPAGDFDTRLHAVATFRLPIPGWLAGPLLTPLALRIFRQDADILSLQTRNLRAFGGEQFASTEIDVLGLQIAQLLKLASRGEAPSPGVHEHRLRMRV